MAQHELRAASPALGTEAQLEEAIVEHESRLRRATIEQRLRYLWLISSLLVAVLLGWAVILGFWQEWQQPFSYIGLIAGLISTAFSVYYILQKRPNIESLKYKLNSIKTNRKYLAAQSSNGLGPARRMYKQETEEIIDQYRKAAKGNRRIHNFLQSIILVGSIVVTSLTSVALNASPFGAAAAVISVFVSIAAAVTGYFKFRERSFGQQQTADAIEKELHSADLMIWDYANKNEDDVLTLFAERVEALKEEQRKRELQLEQSSDRREEQIR
jgi:hypothetical protein